MKSIAVYCGANKGNDPKFEAAARALGKLLAERNIRVVYGGGSVGLMGIIADAVLEHGGAIKGVITHQLNNLELGHEGVYDMHVVETMSERRTLLLQDTDGVITMPGGYGSMDELFEALTLAQLHQYKSPIGLLNVDGYYDPLIGMLDQMVRYGFLREQNRGLCLIDPSPEGLLEQMEKYQYQAIEKWH
ncbi:MAG: TIGR00730 family Rossman fold protein [Chitinophagales bacterium]|jgi:uncharacterized protein (TIGR00730 family)